MTRHQLSMLVLSLAALPGCAGADADRGDEAREPDQVLADSLVGAWLEAAGGMEAWHDVEAARFTITTVWYDSTGEVSRMRPRRVEFRNEGGVYQSRIERPEAEGLYVQVFTGADKWATLNDRPLPADHRATDESEYVGRDVVYWFGLPYKLFDPGVQRRARALPDGGYEVRVTFGDGVGLQPGDRYFYYFLDEDPFPEEVHYISEGRGEESRNRTVWRGYASLGDFTYVVTRRWLDTLDRPTKELRVDDVQLNPTLPDSLFRPPPASGDGE
ncbi:MAG: hypothetical protein R3266_08260 [Gemmatimonadota bacterium]|nr:hypothetical protein [Gemmatimonadota bacterium]